MDFEKPRCPLEKKEKFTVSFFGKTAGRVQDNYKKDKKGKRV